MTDMGSITAWERELDHIEWYVAAVEDAVARGDLVSLAAASPWDPRSELGPMPPEVEARATAILERQRVALAALAEASTQLRGQLGLVTTIGQGTGDTPASTFLDQSC